jgi:hypothetical protein
LDFADDLDRGAILCGTPQLNEVADTGHERPVGDSKWSGKASIERDRHEATR